MRPVRRSGSTALAVAATLVVIAATSTASSAAAAPPGAAPPGGNLAPGIASATGVSLRSAADSGAPRASANRTPPAGVPTTGRYAFLLKLNTRSTVRAYDTARSRGVVAARTAARVQLRAVAAAQNRVIAALPARSQVLYRAHAALPGVAVLTDVRNFSRLSALDGVSTVYPISPKSLSNSYAVPLQGAPPAWQASGDLGQDSTVAVIDSGIDYTHANFGGVGTVADYAAAKARLGKPVSPNEFPGPKVVGGVDFAGDAYNADPTSPDFDPTPAPDPYPLDCVGHGSHVAGTVAGLGENADGTTYRGAYNASTPFASMRIGPGMAPQAKLYAYRVFGCAGSTDLVGAAIDRAVDPNQDGSSADHLDVINMSLGGDFGSPQDGDAMLSDEASALGVSVVVAAGNAGDSYDIGGSPGDAPRAIAVAASADAYSQLDALNVTAPAGIARPYAAERSAAYDYSAKPDLSGAVVRVGDPTDVDGCDPLSSVDTAAVKGKIAFVEWTDTAANRRCGSVARAANLAAAGAIGFVYADDAESFAAGITGSAAIPGVLLAKSGSDAIRARLLADVTVTVGGTSAHGFRQLLPPLNDTLAEFSSRGVRGSGDVKPDVTAVGVSIFSTGSGTGDEGVNDSGTSMATPMVAGTAALLRSQHADWTPEQVKADIMNTADQDLFVGPDHTGAEYAPNRVGAGRIDVTKALGNQVLAYVADDPGSVSASFGPLAVTAPTTLTKRIKVQNTGSAAAAYDVAYAARTSVPGAQYTVSPSTVSVDPGATSLVTLTLKIDPGLLVKTIDPTVNPTPAGIPREFLADASGLVTLTGAGLPSLRVPVYSAPRPASAMTQPPSITLPGGAVQSTVLPLSGHPVDQGSGVTAVRSTVAGFELAATSGAAPACTARITAGCVDFPDERSADLKYVGVTSDAPQIWSIHRRPVKIGLLYFALTTQGAWRTAAPSQVFEVYLDTNGDDVADLLVVNSRLPGTDTMIDETVDLNTNRIVDRQPIDDRFGDTDTALFDSDTMILPVAISALGLGAQSRVRYAVRAFSQDRSGPVDQVGDIGGDGKLINALSFDPLRPGVSVFGSYDGRASALLYRDAPGSVLTVRRGALAYRLDHGLGALIVHFHNKIGAKAQRVGLKTGSGVTMALSPVPGVRGRTLRAAVAVTSAVGIPANGTVTLVRTLSGRSPLTVATGTLNNGKVTLSYVPQRVGLLGYQVFYAGDANHDAGRSARRTIRMR